MRYGRDADSVRLIAVSKSHSAAAIRAAAELGQRDFGENYVQEALPKLAELADLPLTWHYIGQLQANKTRDVAEHFHWVHTLDRERIAVRRLSTCASRSVWSTSLARAEFPRRSSRRSRAACGSCRACSCAV